jgi:glycosyltransferase involved in cell wall biosynthesis
MDWSLIVFSYNEAGSLSATVERCAAFLGLQDGDHEIIVVDDGSTDSTARVCEGLVARFPGLRVLRHTVNLGIGQALRTGYAAASRTCVCAIPGDGQFDPWELAAVPEFSNDRFFAFSREHQHYTPYRSILSIGNRLLNRLFLGLDMKDVNWVKVYHREQLAGLSPRLLSSLVESEICHRLVSSGCRCLELPSTCHIRTHGKAKGGRWSTVSKVLAEAPMFYLRGLLGR